MYLKKTIKRLLPTRILQKIVVARSQERYARFKESTTQQLFSDIYREGMWGKSEDPHQPFYSGDGSNKNEIVTVYVEKVSAFLRKLPKKPNVVDLGCGDFSIGSRLRPFCDDYIACDIVPELIEKNKEKYKDLRVDFKVADLLVDQLPTADIVIVRQVLQHLSNEQIKRLVPKIQTIYKTIILTEHLPSSSKFTTNLDKPTGPDVRTAFKSGVVLTESPFNLRVIEEHVIDEIEEAGGVIRTTVYNLK